MFICMFKPSPPPSGLDSGEMEVQRRREEEEEDEEGKDERDAEDEEQRDRTNESTIHTVPELLMEITEVHTHSQTHTLTNTNALTQRFRLSMVVLKL